MIKSVLDLYRKVPSALFAPEEEVLKKCSGTLDVGQHAFSTFRPCNIYLTNQRLLLAQVKKVIKEFHLKTIKELTVVKRKWLAGKSVPQMKLILKNGEVYFVVMNRPEDWLKAMAKLGKMKIGRRGGI